MKMIKNIISIIAVIFLSCGVAWATDKPLIDPQFKQVQEKIKQLTGECRKREKKPYSRFNCHNRVKKSFRVEGKIRGTEEYCEVNYSNQNFGQMKNLFKKLIDQQKTARHSQDIFLNDDRQFGEVTKEDLQTEIMWIESRLARMQRAKTDRDEKSLKYLPGWGKNDR